MTTTPVNEVVPGKVTGFGDAVAAMPMLIWVIPFGGMLDAQPLGCVMLPALAEVVLERARPIAQHTIRLAMHVAMRFLRKYIPVPPRAWQQRTVTNIPLRHKHQQS